MGCGCLKAQTGLQDPLRPDDASKYGLQQKTPLMLSSQASSSDGATVVCDGGSSAGPEVAAQLGPVIQAAGKSGRVADSTVDEVLGILSTLSPSASSCWLHDWAAKASVKARSGLFQLMHRVIGQAFDSSVTLAEELIASEGGEAGEASDFGQLSELCMDALTLEDSKRNGLRAAMMLLTYANSSGLVDVRDDALVVNPSLDRLVLLFRPSLLAHLATTANNRRLWSELEAHIGLPPLEQHFSLLSCAAKAVLLNLLLVPDGMPAAVVVVNRETALIDAAERLPVDGACILSPSFESATGSKTVQGRRVEGGEGHGPRKEFFMAASEDALRRWCSAPTSSPPGSPSQNVKVLFQGNRVSFEQNSNIAGDQDVAKDVQVASRLLRRALASARVGDRLQFEFSNGVEAERLITAMHEDAGVSVASLFDSSVCSGTVTVRQCGLQKALKPLFEFHRGSGRNWFSAYASELGLPIHGKDLQSRYFAFGKILLLAIANRCKISFALPDMFFHLLLHSDAILTLENLKGFDDDLHSSLKKCLKMSRSDFNGLKDVEGLPSQTTKEDYVSEKVRETFTPQAMSEIRSGFWSLTRRDMFTQVSGSDLRQIVCPTDSLGADIDIKHVFKVVMEDEMAECKLFVDAFWSVVQGFSLEEKKLFLRFVTGLDAPPEPGVERLLIELPFSAFCKDEHIAMLDKLPQAHTCTNTLELPNYHDALMETGKFGKGEAFEKELQRVLGEKLRMAIRETGGYELDAVVDVASTSPTAHLSSQEFEAREREEQHHLPSDVTKDSSATSTSLPVPDTPSIYSGVSEISAVDAEALPRPISEGHESSCSLQSLPEHRKPAAWAADVADKGVEASEQDSPESDCCAPATSLGQPWAATRPPAPMPQDSSQDKSWDRGTSLSLEDLSSYQLRPPKEDRKPSITSVGSKDLQDLPPLKAPAQLRHPGGSIDALEPAREPVRAPVPFMGERGLNSISSTGSDEDRSILTSLLQARPSNETSRKIGSSIDDLIEELDMLAMGKE